MTGMLGKAELAASTDTLLYTVPTGKIATVTISVTNPTPGTTIVDVAVPESDSILEVDKIIKNALIPPAGGFEKTAVVLEAGRRVYVNCGATGAIAHVYGFERNA